MKSLSLFLRTAGQQFSVLTQRLMLALHVKRTAQLGAVLVLSLFVAVFITHSLRTASAQETVAVPDGWRIVALPTDMPSPPLQLRDSVDVVAGQAVIAAGVLVVSLQPLTIAVPADVAASVASVAQLGEASLISAR